MMRALVRGESVSRGLAAADWFSTNH